MEKNMEENFLKLERRVVDSLNDSDTLWINKCLTSIDTPTLTSGVGGSSVVSLYASKVLNRKNGIISTCVEPRDFNYMNLNGYKNVLACSYSGNNYGVKVAFLNDLKHYLLSCKENNGDGIINLNYKCLDSEHSFISLAASLIPCSILLNYYLDNDKNRVIDNLGSYDFNFSVDCDAFEIFSGFETSVPSKYLESTMVEAGIGIPVIHDKYSYCHGRSTLSTTKENIAIYFNLGTDLDKLLLSEIYKYYKDVIVLDCSNDLVSEYNLLVRCMYLTRYIALKMSKDLSGVDYNKIVKKVYKYDGNM